MKPPLPRTLSAVPQTLHARLEIAKAIRTLAGPDEDELLRQRRAEIAAIRRDLEALSREIRKAGEECLALAKAELREALKKYHSDRPMVLTATGFVPIEANAAQQEAAANGQDANRQGAELQTLPAIQKYGYSPDQPRVPAGSSDGGQWTTGPQYAALTPKIDPSALTGISQIDDVTKRLAQILQNVVNTLALLPGQPQRYGRLVHRVFAAAVIAEGIRGISPLDVERTFNLPPGYSEFKDTVRPDVVLRNDIGDIVAIYDVKTLDATLDPWRARELRAAAGVGREVPVIELHVGREPALKAWCPEFC
jgi:hypothetical protein